MTLIAPSLRVLTTLDATAGHRGILRATWTAPILLVVLVVLASTVGGTFADKFSVPGAESQKVLDVLKERFPELSGDTARVVFKSDTDIRADQAVRDRIRAFVTAAQSLPEVAGIASPLDPNTPTISQGGTIA